MLITEDHKNEIIALFKRDGVEPLFGLIPPNTTAFQIPVVLRRVHHAYIEDVKLRLYTLQDGSQFYVGEHSYQEGKNGPVEQIIIASEKEEIIKTM